MRNIRSNINRLMTHKYPFVIFFLLSLIPFYWLRGYPIGYGDAGLMSFFYNPEYLSSYKYTWVSQYLTGHFSIQNIFILPISGLFSVLAFFGLNSYVQQAFAYFLVLFASMSFMYLFVYELFDYRVDKKLIALISAVFYIFNPVVMIEYWYTNTTNSYLLPFVPLVLYLFLVGLRRQKFLYILLMSLMFSFLSIVFLNPAFAIPVMMILMLYFIYQIALCWKNKDRIKKILIYTTILTIICLLINAWWILPFIPSIGNDYNSAISRMNPSQTLIDANYSTSFSTSLRLIPWKLDAGVWAYKNPEWRYFYDNPLFIFVGISTFSLMLIPLILRKKDKNILFFALLLIIGLFLCHGLNSPFGYIFKYMFGTIPFFDIFRNPYSKFAPILLVSYSVLFGMGVTVLYNKIGPKIGIRYSKVMVLILLFLICGIYVFPMWTGAVVNTPITIRGDEISSFVEVPLYYQDIAEYFHETTNNRILSLPLRPSTYVAFNWKYGYDGPDCTWLLYKHETISYLMDDYYLSAQIVSKLEDQNLEKNLYEITNLFSVRYIVIQNDVDIVHGNYNNKTLTGQQELKSILNQLNVTFVRSFGKLDLYKIDDQYITPRIYPTAMPILVKGSLDDMLSVVTSDNFTKSKSALFLSNQMGSSQWDFLEKYVRTESNSTPTVTFQKINPTRYEIKVENATKPFFLIFSESYDPGWKAYVDKNTGFNEIIAEYPDVRVKEAKQEMSFTPTDVFLFTNPLDDKYHFITNGYANAWYINPKEIDKDGDGNFTISLYFWPQSLFYLGLIISGTTLILCMGYLIYDWRKNNGDKQAKN